MEYVVSTEADSPAGVNEFIQIKLLLKKKVDTSCGTDTVSLFSSKKLSNIIGIIDDFTK